MGAAPSSQQLLASLLVSPLLPVVGVALMAAAVTPAHAVVVLSALVVSAFVVVYPVRQLRQHCRHSLCPRCTGSDLCYIGFAIKGIPVVNYRTILVTDCLALKWLNFTTGCCPM